MGWPGTRRCLLGCRLILSGLAEFASVAVGLSRRDHGDGPNRPAAPKEKVEKNEADQNDLVKEAPFLLNLSASTLRNLGVEGLVTQKGLLAVLSQP